MYLITEYQMSQLFNYLNQNDPANKALLDEIKRQNVPSNQKIKDEKIMKVKIEDLVKNPGMMHLFGEYTIELTKCEETLLSKSATPEQRLQAAGEWHKQGVRNLK